MLDWRIASANQKAVGPTVATEVEPMDMPMLRQHQHAIWGYSGFLPLTTHLPVNARLMFLC